MSIIGPYEGQRILSQSRSMVEEVNALDSTLPFGLEQGSTLEQSTVQTSPILDILQGSHDRLYTRIFNS
jgi:urease accessory protein